MGSIYGNVWKCECFRGEQQESGRDKKVTKRGRVNRLKRAEEEKEIQGYYKKNTAQDLGESWEIKKDF